jgi:hypothetical protein
MESIITERTVGKYRYKIIDNTLSLREQIYSRTVKIGGNYPDCVSISITYNSDNKPESAYIPYIMYDPECSFDVALDRGQGSITMIKTLFDYIHHNLPAINEINFEDKSNIECATEEEIAKGSRFKKKGTNVYPIPLYYFSIAFNGETWYEKHFNARQKDIHKRMAYKEKINYVLHSIELKTSISFLQFLQIAIPPIEVIDELEKYFNNSATFGELFQMIPKKDRCRLVRDWISVFMYYYLQDVFDNKNWIIEIPLRQTGGKRNTRKYYCPKCRIKRNITYKDFGIDETNC